MDAPKKNKITALESLESIESALALIAKLPDAQLQVPKDAINKYKGAMHDASRLQMLATWARYSSNPILSFHSSNLTKKVIDDLGTYAPGIAAIRLATAVAVGDDVVSRREAIRSATTKMINTNYGKLSSVIHGRTIDLTCVSGVNIQYLRPLFSAREKGAVRDKAGMLDVLEELFEIINRGDADLIPRSFLEACSIFTSELFLNTQEHATSDHVGRPYAAHVEGVIVSWDEMEGRFYKKDFQGHKRLQQFWDREVVSIRGQEAIRCLQLSFFDTGPGFASRISGKDFSEMSLDEEREYLGHCLVKNTSTKRQVGSGLGLALVLDELRLLGGVIRIRSGRHSIFNCFSGKDDEDIYDFDDWNTTPFSRVAGAVVSILVPLRRK